MADRYNNLKEKAYSLATTLCGKSTVDAKSSGFRDVFDYIMSDSDHFRQAAFLVGLPNVLSQKQRQILLDGLANEYAGADGWVAYVERQV